MKHNLRRHEIMGVILVFLAATCFGIGLYMTIWAAVRPLFHGSLDYLISPKDYLLFPIFYGVSAVLWVFGNIELREALPGKGRND